MASVDSDSVRNDSSERWKMVVGKAISLEANCKETYEAFRDARKRSEDAEKAFEQYKNRGLHDEASINKEFVVQMDTANSPHKAIDAPSPNEVIKYFASAMAACLESNDARSEKLKCQGNLEKALMELAKKSRPVPA